MEFIEGMSIAQIAQIAHEANRVIQIVNDEPNVSPHWEDAPEDQRASAIDGVSKSLFGITAEKLHEEWANFKSENGWVYGEVKDAEKKTHPCLVPYDELDHWQKFKDHLFATIVATCAKEM